MQRTSLDETGKILSDGGGGGGGNLLRYVSRRCRCRCRRRVAADARRSAAGDNGVCAPLHGHDDRSTGHPANLINLSWLRPTTTDSTYNNCIPTKENDPIR